MRDPNPAFSLQLLHMVPTPDAVDATVIKDYTARPVTRCPRTPAICTTTATLSPYPSRHTQASYSRTPLPNPTMPTKSRTPDSLVPNPFHTNISLATLRTSSDAASNISVPLITTRSLLPRLPPIQAIFTTACPTSICNTETWFIPSTPDALISILGYTISHSDRSRRHVRGCLTYSRTEMDVFLIDDPLLANTPDCLAFCLSV
ncbi:hypothetical protein CSKR_203208 [Clonorchis sinensis]|uniref:Uncharacterized protein n=1 Tax=Clonorchis sinensis TaxID=79923 RepID=A0A8T1M8R4_CLOSI|nr:hypothetical protein CSKR_203208 [Clonorchis sinensis]